MNKGENNEFVARCDGIATQRATNQVFSATNGRNDNATNNLKALAHMVLERNTPRKNSATDTQKTAQQTGQKNTDFVARSCSESCVENNPILAAECNPKTPDVYPKKVTCFTPAGEPMQVMAKDVVHGQFLLAKNPKPPAVANSQLTGHLTCGTCQHFTPHHVHGKGSGTCTLGIMPGGAVHWSETQHDCNRFQLK